jgi:hypothetical protein
LVLQVTDIRLITDRHTKRSKGLAYVEFSKQEEVFVALALTGQRQQQGMAGVFALCSGCTALLLFCLCACQCSSCCVCAQQLEEAAMYACISSHWCYTAACFRLTFCFAAAALQAS